MGRNKVGRKALLEKAVEAAILLKDREQLCHLVTHEGVNPNKFPSHSTMLHAAVQLEDPILLQFLLNLPHIRPCKPDSAQRTAFQLAVHSHPSMVPIFLNYSAVIQHECPFHALVETVAPAKRVNSNTKKYIQLLKSLKEKGLHLPCACTKLPLCHLALSKGNSYFLEALLGAGGDPNETDCNDQTLIMAAAKQGHLPSLRAVILRGARTWDSALNDICSNSSISSEIQVFIRRLLKRRAVFYILKFRDVGAPLFSVLSLWLIKEIIALV